MAFLQRKRTSQSSPGMHLLLHTQQDSAISLLRHTLQREATERPTGHSSPSMSIQRTPTTTREKPSWGTGVCPPRRTACALRRRHSRSPRAPGRLSGRSRHPAHPGPLLPPSGLLPRRSGLPRGAAGGGRKKTLPAPLPQHRAPRGPSGLEQAVIGGIPAPGLPRGAPLGARPRIAATATEKAAAPPPRPAQSPGTHLSQRRPRKRESSRERGADRGPGRRSPRPRAGEGRPGRRADRHLRAPQATDDFRGSEA